MRYRLRIILLLVSSLHSASTAFSASAQEFDRSQMTDAQIVDEFKSMGSYLFKFLNQLPVTEDHPTRIDSKVFSKALGALVSVDDHVFVHPVGSSKEVEVTAKYDSDLNKIVIGRTRWKSESKRIETLKIALHEYLRATRGQLQDDNYERSGPFIKSYGEDLLREAKPVNACLAKVIFKVDGVQFLTGKKISGAVVATKTIPIKPFDLIKQWLNISQMTQSPNYFSAQFDTMQMKGNSQELKRIATQLNLQMDLMIEPSPMGRISAIKVSTSEGKLIEQSTDKSYQATIDFDPIDFSDLSCLRCSQGRYRPKAEVVVTCN